MACNSLDSAYRDLFLSFAIVVGFTPSLWWEPGPGTVVAMPPAAPCLEDEAAEGTTLSLTANVRVLSP